MTDTHIKINNVTPKVQYTGNGSTVSFPYSFAIFDDSDMVVYLGDTIITTGYTVSGAGQTEGGNVVFDTAPADGTKITLLRSVPIERVTDFQEGGTFRPKNINDEFDRQTAFVQQVQETLDRAVKVGPTSDITPEVVLAHVERVYSSIDNVDTVADNITDVNSVAANATNINTVAGSISDVNAVGASISNVNSVAADLTNVDSVAGDLTNIDTVAGIASDVSGVAAISSDVTAVNSNKTNINKVAGDISRVGLVADDIDSVHTVAVDISNVIDVADNKTNIDTVAGDISDVSTVAGSISNVNTVAGSISNVTAVAGNATNINAVAADLTDIESVASNITNVNAVADNETNINAAVSNATDISTVATNIANVGTVATNISDVNDCATNMADITSASTNAALAKDWANKTGSTVDGSEYSAKYYAQQAASTLANKIDKGYAVNDFATNCITEIPQDIKLELSSGTLTLKSGSILTIPNGSQYQLTEDKTYTYSSTTDDGQYVMFASRSTGSIQGPIKISNVLSGPTENRPEWSSSIRGMVYYDSNTNKITLAGGSAWNDDWGVAFPFCIVTLTNNVITSIDKVFNGAGYIGHHSFVLPGVKGLFANGRNADGTLKTSKLNVTALCIIKLDANQDAITCYSSSVVAPRINSGEIETLSDLPSSPPNLSIIYVRDINTVYYKGTSSQPYQATLGHYTIIADYTYDGTTVTKFDIRPVSGLADEYITTALGYTPENVSNKVTSVSGSSTDTQYPSAKLLYDTKTTIESSISTTNANVSALESNKIDKGYAVNDFATNCITEIPQDITLTLSSGTLTIKDGSVITLADGTQKTISGDKTYTHSTNGTYFAVTTATGGSLRLSEVSNTCSGSTDALAGVANHTWYDTTNNVITVYGSDGTSAAGTRALPVGIVTVSNGSISSIDKVFNGIGFIGTAFFALPGMSYLFADGLNTDGTLKFGYKKLTSLVVRNFSLADNTYVSWLNHNSVFATNYASNVYYNAETNHVVSSNTDQRGCVVVNWTQSGGVITDFNVRPVSGLSANYINTALGYVPERAEKPLNTLSTSGTISPATNTYNYIAPTGAVTLSLPASPTATIVNEIELQVNQSSAVTFAFGSNVLWGEEGAPDMGVGLWDIIFTWIQGANKWLGSYKKWTTS